MNTILYEIDDNLYVNLTNKCTNDCTFCVRNYSDNYSGYNLRLTEEPSVPYVSELLSKMDLAKYNEVVFCGYGEPLMRAPEVLVIAKLLKSNGVRTRINTNGQYFFFASKILAKTDFCGKEKELIEELGLYIDTISISLNEVTEEAYLEISRPSNKEKPLASLLAFASFCVGKFKNVILSVVDIIGKDKLKKADEIAKSVGAVLRVREFISDEG